MKTALRRRTTASESRLLDADSILAREQKAFQQQRQRLLKRYAGEYVALQGGRVVAHDRDDEALAARMFARFGETPFYITHVGATPLVSEIPSPELPR